MCQGAGAIARVSPFIPYWLHCPCDEKWTIAGTGAPDGMMQWCMWP